MAVIPRNTESFEKRTAARLQDLQSARKHPAIGPAWERARTALFRAVAHGVEKPFPLSQADSEVLWAESAHDRAVHQDSLHQLLMLIRQHAPDLDLAFGAQLVKFVGICHFAELGLEPHPEWGESVARLSPDNPIERLAENVYYIPEDVSAYRDAKHRRQCLLELDGYFQALQPAIPRGRPPKEPSETPRQGQIKQDTEWDAKALTAYQASQEQKEKGQKDWKAIATAVGFKVPGDKRARKNLREKIGRLVYSGRKLSTPPE